MIRQHDNLEFVDRIELGSYLTADLVLRVEEPDSLIIVPNRLELQD